MSYEIVKATRADVEDIISLGMELGQKSFVSHRAVVDEYMVRALVHSGIDREDQIWLVLKNSKGAVGFIFGQMCELFFANKTFFQEFGFYIRPTLGLHSLRLVIAFEKMAKEKGAAGVMFGSMPEFCDISRFCKYRGYRKVEEHFFKEI